MKVSNDRNFLENPDSIINAYIKVVVISTQIAKNNSETIQKNIHDRVVKVSVNEVLNGAKILSINLGFEVQISKVLALKNINLSIENIVLEIQTIEKIWYYFSGKVAHTFRWGETYPIENFSKNRVNFSIPAINILIENLEPKLDPIKRDLNTVVTKIYLFRMKHS